MLKELDDSILESHEFENPELDEFPDRGSEQQNGKARSLPVFGVLFMIVGIAFMGYVLIHALLAKQRFDAVAWQAPVPAPIFSCQEGDGRNACVPLLREDGKWAMTAVGPDGALSDESQMSERVPVLSPSGLKLTATTLSGRHRHEQSSFALPDGAGVPVMMPDGTLAVAKSSSNKLILKDARQITGFGNPAQPKALVDTALAAVR